MTNTSREVEHEAATSRARLSGLLDELRFRVSPGEVVERLVREADRDGAGSEFMRTLRQQVRSNPVACMLIAAGITWMMLADLQKNRRTSHGGEEQAAAPSRVRARRSRTKKAVVPPSRERRWLGGPSGSFGCRKTPLSIAGGDVVLQAKS
jgi:hypothetical protein